MQGTRAPLTPKDQPCGNFCDCRKHTGSKKTFPDGSGHRREESQIGGDHGGGELRRDGLKPHFSLNSTTTTEMKNNAKMDEKGDMLLVQRLSKLQCKCFNVNLYS